MIATKTVPKKQIVFNCDIDSEAHSAYLVGDFNDWQPTAKKMKQVKNGTFQTTIRLAPGEYQYKFIVDGVWFNDPAATEQAVNLYGTLNSIIRVE